MNFSGVLTAFKTGTYTVSRRTPTTVGPDGRADVADPTTLLIQASVEPTKGRMLQRLPEGERVTEHRVLYTATRLQVIGDPDIVTIDGEDWEVESVSDWALGKFFAASLVRK